MLMKLLSILFVLPYISFAANCPQSKPVDVTKTLIQKIANLEPDSSNAHEVEMMIGPACACVPGNSIPSKIWVCQWKGDLSSNRLEKTINITFEAGMIANIIGIDEYGKYLIGENGKKVKLVKEQA